MAENSVDKEKLMDALIDKGVSSPEEQPSEETLASIKEIREGKGTKCGSFEDYLEAVAEEHGSCNCSFKGRKPEDSSSR